MGPAYDNWKERRRLIDLRVCVLQEIRKELETKSCKMFWRRYGTSFQLGRSLCGALQLLKAEIGLDGKPRWRHFARQYPDANVHVLGRLEDDDRTTRDFYVIPASRIERVPTILPIENGPDLERFYCPNLPTAIDRVRLIAGGKRRVC